MLMYLLAAHAGSTRAALTTHAFLPRDVVAPGAPIVLDLGMQNKTDGILMFEQFRSPNCFLMKYAEIEVRPPVQRKDPGPCSAPSDKVRPDEIIGRQIDLRQVFEMPDQEYFFVVKWKDGGPDIYSPLEQSLGPLQVKAPIHSGKMEVEGEVYLPNKSTVVFQGHESKPSPKRGERPLLVVKMLVRKPGEGEFPQTITMNLDKKRQFQLDGYTFDVIDHQFGQWMQVQVFE